MRRLVPTLAARSRTRGLARRPRLEGLEPRDLPATLTVSSLADSGTGTLRAAIEQANADLAADVITFAPGLSGTITLETALPDLATDITLQGPGASTLTLARDQADGTPFFGILAVDKGATVAISGLTIADGGSSKFNTLSMGGVHRGGGISNVGTLTVASCIIRDNAATVATGMLSSAEGPQGGGIYNEGTLSLVGSNVAGNQAEGVAADVKPTAVGAGGGVFNGGTAVIVNSTLGGNTSASVGGGLYSTGTAILIGSTVAGNTSSTGGGLFSSGTVVLFNSTVSFNRGGNPFLAGTGGGIFNGGNLVAIASTVAANLAISGTGGIDTSDGTPAGGTPAGTLTLIDSIVAGNLGTGRPNGGIPVPLDVTGPVSPFSAFNVIGASTSLVNGVAGNKVGTSASPIDPKLGPLADNGGPSQTMALLAGSPALDAGLPLPFLTTDQRGVKRPQGPTIDIGAFEAEGLPTPPPRITGLRRFGSGLQPTRIVLSVDRPLKTATADNLANYTLTAQGRRIPIAAVVYNIFDSTITIVPARRLPLSGRYTLRVNGSSPGGVTGLDGALLDGNGDGSPGGDYVKTFGREAFVPTP